MITRFAPTPSGFLHLGNAVNAQLVSWLAAGGQGSVALRIDDMDTSRLRDEYVDDIFDLLAWLGISWEIGPSGRDDLASVHSTRVRTEYYRDELQAAVSRGLVAYACRCSRSMISGVAVGGCPGDCRRLNLALEPGVTALRVHVPPETLVIVEGGVVQLDEEVGDFVVWRRDDLPAYHLVSVIEDRDLGTTHVVRGADLRQSTAAQLFFARYLAAPTVERATYLHHPLVVGPGGAKLSKSQLVTGRPLERSESMRRLVRQTAAEIGAPIGIRPPAPS